MTVVCRSRPVAAVVSQQPQHRGRFTSPGGKRNTDRSMEKALWYLLTATRGGQNRVRIVRHLSDRPMNANELATELDVSYKTVRHHLEMLEDHGIVETGEESYAKLHFLTDRFKANRETFEEIAGTLDMDRRDSHTESATEGDG